MKFEQQPIQLLREIAQSSMRAIINRPANNDLQNAWSGIGFSLCGQQMVAPMGEVVEIINVPNYTFVPRVKAWVMGIANVRGRLLPIYDLENYFGSKLAGNRNRHRVLIIEVDGIYAGIVVSNVFGLKHFPKDSFNNYQGDGDLFAGCIDACGHDGQADWLRFQAHRLVRETDFMDVSIQANNQSTDLSANQSTSSLKNVSAA